MEICLNNYGNNKLKEFKIDLIVWKYKVSPSPLVITSMFKIDLIVWKYVPPVPMSFMDPCLK